MECNVLLFCVRIHVTCGYAVRFLFAWARRAFGRCMWFADLDGSGESSLLMGTLDKRLKVYKGECVRLIGNGALLVQSLRVYERLCACVCVNVCARLGVHVSVVCVCVLSCSTPRSRALPALFLCCPPCRQFVCHACMCRGGCAVAVMCGRPLCCVLNCAVQARLWCRTSCFRMSPWPSVRSTLVGALPCLFSC